MTTRTTLAWCGWRLRMPETWRPLRLEGGQRTGSMMIGDATEAKFKVSWASVAPSRAKRAWSRRRGRAGGQAETPPAAGGFSECRLLRSDQNAQAIWTGYAESAGLLVELVYNREGEAGGLAEIERTVLPSLAAEVEEDGATLWSIFGTSFRVPRGFVLTDRSLHLGEISLRFARRKERLAVGQVYPAELALSRRPLGFWLRNWPWERNAARRFRADGEDRPWRVERGGDELAGLLRAGRKALRWPLGFLGAQRTLSAAVVDGGLGRIFRAEIESPRGPDEAVLKEAIRHMDAETAVGP